jgi:hypothetical protein
MGSDAPRSVGAVGATNRTVVPITITVRICLANSHRSIRADASGSVHAIGTSGCAARLREHERSKCNHDGEHRCAISGKAQRRVFHFGYLLDDRSAGLLRRCSRIKTPAMMAGVSPYSITRCGEMHHLRWETSRCALSIPTLSNVATNACQLTINCRMTRSHARPCACATRSLAEGEARWTRDPPTGITIGVQPCADLIEPTT